MHWKCQGLRDEDTHRAPLPTSPSGQSTLRWMLHHMLEETGRHAGHLDSVRELLDGEEGYY